MYIEKDGKIYEVIEREIDIDQEEYKLQSWKDALINDAREIEEYNSKIQEINSLPLEDKYKDLLKLQVTISSPSGISQKMIDDQQKIVDNLKKI